MLQSRFSVTYKIEFWVTYKKIVISIAYKIFCGSNRLQNEILNRLQKNVTWIAYKKRDFESLTKKCDFESLKKMKYWSLTKFCDFNRLQNCDFNRLQNCDFNRLQKNHDFQSRNDRIAFLLQAACIAYKKAVFGAAYKIEFLIAYKKIVFGSLQNWGLSQLTKIWAGLRAFFYIKTGDSTLCMWPFF